jgi:hypothetical protein
MGATSAQGWYLFVFIVGFTLGPAGLLALGWPVALIGFALMAIALAGFRSIKTSAAGGPESREPARVVPPVGQQAAKSF